MHGCWLGWLTFLFAAPPEVPVDPRVLAAEAQRVATIERVAPGVIVVLVPGTPAGGSGVIINAEGWALTNFHVTAGRNWFLCGLSGGRTVHAVLVGVDPVGDLALIQLLGSGPFAPIPLGDSDRLTLGEPVLALGNPFLLASDFEPTVSLGIVSGLHRYQYPSQTLLEYTDAIQTDAAINPGNSGGALVNRQGELVGINGRASFDARGRVNVGLAYAISINQAKNFLDHLAGGLIVDHASLGATAAGRSDTAHRGAVVDEISATSDAYRLGLRAGDEIVSFANRKITSVNQFKGLLGTMPKGWRVPITYRRDEAEETIRPRLEGVHRPAELIALTKPQPKKPAEAKSTPPAAPDSVQAVLQSRDGYANYYFQRAARDRWLGMLRKSHRAERNGRWKLQLKGEDGVAVDVTLTDEAAAWTSNGATVVYEPGTALAAGRPGPIAPLAVLSAWRWFLLRLHHGLDRCDYVGAFPDAGGVISPALQTESEAGIRTLWLIDRAAGLLRIVESLSANGDCCELALADYRIVDGRQLPRRWEFSVDGTTVGKFVLTAAEFAP